MGRTNEDSGSVGSIGRMSRVRRIFVTGWLTLLSQTAASQSRRSGGDNMAPAINQVTRNTPSLTPFAVRKAEVLLRDHLPCLGCHTLNGSGGHIGPDLSSVRSRRSREFIAAMVADPQRVVPGSAMPKTLMLSSTQDLIVQYLQTRPGNVASDVAAAGRAPPLAAPSGAALYAQWCAACHGARGKGDGPNAPNLPVPPADHTDRSTMSLRPDDSLYDTIAGGGAIMNRSARMPAFGATLTPNEMHALVEHIRTLCRCQGPDWSRRRVPGT